MKPQTRDRGAAEAVGLVVLVVPMMAFVALVLYLARGVDVEAQMRSAAEAAAQAAALERDPGLRWAAAYDAADAMLSDTDCPDPWVGLHYLDRAGSVGTVGIDLACTRSTEDYRSALSLERTSDTSSVSAFATLDQYRASP